MMGYKAFCKDCEGKFQQGETFLNSEIYQEFYRNPAERIERTVQLDKENSPPFPWLFYALISIVWRTLCFFPRNADFIEVLETLRDYLLNWNDSNAQIDSKVKLFIFAPNSDLDKKVEQDNRVYRHFFYDMFHARFDVGILESKVLSSWVFLGPMHVLMLYSTDQFKSLEDHWEDYSKCDARSKLTSKTKAFTIGTRSSRFYPMSVYPIIVQWGSRSLSSTIRIPGAVQTPTSGTNYEILATHVHLLPKDVSYSEEEDMFEFSSTMYEQKTHIQHPKPFLTIVGVSKPRQKRVTGLFVAVKGGLKNGGEVAIGLELNEDQTVGYMKGVTYCPQTQTGVDLTNPPFKSSIEEECRSLNFSQLQCEFENR